jgi:hypothetical protein
MTMSAQQKMAEMRKRQKQRRKEAKEKKSNSGGGGGNTFEIGSSSFWMPDDGALWMHKHSTGGTLHVRLYPLEDIGYLTTHSINRASGDSSVIPRFFQRKNAQYNSYRCTFDWDAGPKSRDGWNPSPNWEESDDDDIPGMMLVDRETGVRTYVPYVMEEEAWGCLAPAEHPYPRAFGDYFPEALQTYAEPEDAQFVAEKLLAQTHACTFCTEAQHEWDAGVDKDDRVMGFRTDDMPCIPVYVLEWMHGNENKKDAKKAGYMNLPRESSAWKFMSCDASHGIRMGGMWYTASLDEGRSSGFHTFQNLMQHVSRVRSTCKSCLKDGATTGRTHHQIHVKRLYCPSCNEDWVTPNPSDEGPSSISWGVDECNHSEDIEVYEAYTTECQCPHCKYVGLPEEETECSTPGCNTPERTNVTEVITSVKATKVGKGTGYTFSVYADRLNNHRIVLKPSDWEEMPMHHPPSEKTKNLPSNVAEDYEKRKPDFSKTTFYPDLSPQQQARLIDSQALPYGGAS